MILIGFNTKLFDSIQNEYTNEVLTIDVDKFKNNTSSTEQKYPINLLEFIKSNLENYDIIYINYSSDIIAFLNAIKLSFSYIYDSLDVVPDNVRLSDINKFILNETFTLEKFLSQFDWYKIPVIESNKESVSIINEHKPKTLQDLINDDANLTDLDVVDLKQLQNKLKMGVLLQAKSMLKRVLQLTNILDKLYDELLGRIENSITTTDTASLMYTTEYISKALSDTNQFIVSLVNNEKIQNFFIVDNSTVINTGNDTIDIDKRERIRKAAEIILNNYDNLANNQLDKVVDPNSVIEVEKVEDDRK